MQKWEYQFVELGVDKGNWLPRSVNGTELPNWKKGSPSWAYCNQLGDQGWELIEQTVTFSDYGNIHNRWWIFKRPKS